MTVRKTGLKPLGDPRGWLQDKLLISWDFNNVISTPGLDSGCAKKREKYTVGDDCVDDLP